jgi:hypothetical protein
MANLSSITRRSIVAAGASLPAVAVLSSTARGVHAAGSDVELLELGRKLVEAWREERALVATLDLNYDDYSDEMQARFDAVDEACAKCRAIVDRIEQSPATTLNGLRVKAQAILWSRSGDMDFLSGDLLNRDSFDVCLARSIVRDLIG